jgi:hypothetical protein
MKNPLYRSKSYFSGWIFAKILAIKKNTLIHHTYSPCISVPPFPHSSVSWGGSLLFLKAPPCMEDSLSNWRDFLPTEKVLLPHGKVNWNCALPCYNRLGYWQTWSHASQDRHEKKKKRKRKGNKAGRNWQCLKPLSITWNNPSRVNVQNNRVIPKVTLSLGLLSPPLYPLFHSSGICKVRKFY